MEAPQNRRFLWKDGVPPPLAHLDRWKGEDFEQNITYSKGRHEAFSIHPSVSSSVSSSIHGWHHVIILYNVQAEKLL
jgi:hypothetical protein